MENKWAKYWNLPEIVAIREKIVDTYTNKLIFLEEPHEYYLDGVQYMCVSDVTHQFKPSDSKQMAEGCVKRWQRDNDPEYKYYGMSVEEILSQWEAKSKKACDFGTEVHAFGESMFYYMTGQEDKILPECKDRFIDGTPHPQNEHEEAVVKFWNDIPENMVPVLAETKVFNRNGYPYAGTFDILFYYVDVNNKTNSGLCIFDYKGLDLNIPILTNVGWKTMGTVEVGDVVYDENGEETKILNTSEIHHNPCYKITFDNNTSIIADHEHKWKIYFFRSNGHNKECIMTTEELFIHLNTLDKRISCNIPKIKINKPISGNNTDLLIDPYVLGVWLGDGHTSCGMITNMYDDIFDEISKRGYNIGPDVSKNGAGKAKSRTIYGLATQLKHYNLLKNKHIPHEYLCANVDVKLDILRGLMDTDGYYNKKRKRFVLTTTRESQANFCKELLSSLGIKNTVIKCKKYCNDKKIDGYDVTFFSDIYPFLIRKIEIEKQKSNKHDFLNIKSIEKIDTVPTRCIEVDSPEHTFVVGKDMVVTHNTNIDLFKNFREQTLLFPFNDMLDCNYSLYTLQLNCYQIPLENLNMKVVGRRLIWLKPDGMYDKIKVGCITNRLREALGIPSAEKIIKENLV